MKQIKKVHTLLLKKKKTPISMEVVGLETGSFDLTDTKKSKQIDYL